MCQLGGGNNRCEYADMLSNVRKKARNKYRGEHRIEYKVEDEVRAWQAAHPDLVRKHLPERMPFQCATKDRPVPKELVAILTPSSRVPVTGAMSKEERLEKVVAMNKAFEDWETRLNNEEANAVNSYTMHGFTLMNSVLRKKGFSQAMKKDYTYARTKEAVDEIRDRTKNQIKSMKSAMKKSVKNSEPRKLYRFFRIPAGITPTEYMEKYLATGEGFSDPAFMSTTTDPEFIMAHMYDRNNGARNHGYIVMEILTKQGQSLQRYPYQSPGNIQSMESEVILPAATKLRVVGHNKAQRFEYGSERKDLYQQYKSGWGDSHWFFEKYGHHSKGNRLNFPMIKLIDEKLLDEYEKESEKKLK